MRIAIVSDIHGNQTAFEAVLADLRQTSPDMVVYGGHLADSGASPVEIVDRIRELGWQGVVGDTDEMFFRPESRKEFGNQTPKLQPLFTAIEEMAVAAREALGSERLAWLSSLPHIQIHGPVALVRQPQEPLALSCAGSERCRVRIALLASRTADRCLWAYPSLIHSERLRSDRRQPGQRGSFLRAIVALGTSCWMNPGQQSGMWNTTWTRNFERLAIAAFPTRIGWPKFSIPAALRCHRQCSVGDIYTFLPNPLRCYGP